MIHSPFCIMGLHVQQWSNLTLLWAHLPLFGILIWPWPMWPLTLTHVTFDLDICDLCKFLENYVWFFTLWPWPMTLTFTPNLDTICIHRHTKLGEARSNGSWDMNYYPVTFCLVWILVKSRTSRQKAMHMSPPCICTGVLKKGVRLFRNFPAPMHTPVQLFPPNQ